MCTNPFLMYIDRELHLARIADLIIIRWIRTEYPYVIY